MPAGDNANLVILKLGPFPNRNYECSARNHNITTHIFLPYNILEKYIDNKKKSKNEHTLFS